MHLFMKSILYAVLLLVAAGCVVEQRGPVYDPQPPAYYHDSGSFANRIDQQQRRIDQGRREGELTSNEASTLQRNLERIRRKFDRMKTDGILTSEEMDRLERLLDRNSQMIYDKRHNAVRNFSDNDFDIQNRIDRQQQRIEQGIATRQLTRSEAAQLQDNLDYIQRRYRRMVADGRLTESEIDEIDRLLDLNSAMIYDNRRNAPRRLY